MNIDWRTKLRETFSVPKSSELAAVVRSLSPSERAVFFALVALVVGSTLSMLLTLNRLISVEVPARGGSLVEGVIGSPRFINPLLAISDADRDLTELVYSGLLRALPDGSLVPDLAGSYSASENGLSYTFTVREDAEFQDGAPVTADDVLFTIQRAQDPTLKSPKRANWEGVVVEKMGEREVRFTLRQPYAPFLENATIGILPAHIWKDADAEQFAFSQFNIEPVGSGPYRVDSITRNSSGVPDTYELVPFEHFALGEPYIARITLRFYANESALTSAYIAGDIDALNSIAPEKVAGLAKRGGTVIHGPLPRIFGVFLNQNQSPLFADKVVRTALDVGVDKERIVREVLSGYGSAIDGPVPPGILPGELEQPTPGSPERMAALLEAAGWKRGEDGIFEKTVRKKKERLEFSLATSNVAELKAAGEIIREEWGKGGAKVDLKVFEVGDLNQNVIRPRKYDALLFGEIVGRTPDLFAFWHSSQRNDPGLNIALYANIAADKSLEKARVSADRRERLEAYEDFATEVTKDTPAVFLYTPDFIYILPPKVRGVSVGPISISSERFLNAHEWYIETDRVWHFFSNR